MSTAMSGAFQTVPKDYLSLLKGAQPRPQPIVKFIEFKKQDVARATGVPESSIRYDEKMPSELADRFREWAIMINHVAGFFKGDADKTALWFMTPNPLLGNIPPRDMIRFGRSKKLLKFILEALAENRA